MFLLIINKGLKYSNSLGFRGGFLINSRSSLGYLIGCIKSMSLNLQFWTIIMVNLIIKA